MALSAQDLAVKDVIDPDRYASSGYPHGAWRVLRRDAPLHWFDFGERPGFWAVTRRADIVWLSKQPERFLIAPRQAVFAESPARQGGQQSRPFRNLLNMDPPEHAAYRRLASAWFTPRAIGRRRPEVERLADELLDRFGESGQADFVADFTAPLTLSVLADMLGVPRSDWEQMFAWTNQIAGSTDPEFQTEGGGPVQAAATMQRAMDEMFAYFSDLALERRAAPRVAGRGPTIARVPIL